MSKMMKKVEKFLKENPEEAKKLIEKIDAMDINGPTVDEYLDFMEIHYDKGILVDKSKATKTLDMGTLDYPKGSRLNK